MMRWHGTQQVKVCKRGIICWQINLSPECSVSDPASCQSKVAKHVRLLYPFYHVWELGRVLGSDMAFVVIWQNKPVDIRSLSLAIAYCLTLQINK